MAYPLDPPFHVNGLTAQPQNNSPTMGWTATRAGSGTTSVKAMVGAEIGNMVLAGAAGELMLAPSALLGTDALS